MERFYEKIVSNSLNEIDKVHLKLILQKYNDRLQRHNETLDNLNNTEVHKIVKTKGRPKGTAKFTAEERKERARLSSKRYYDLNIEKENYKFNEYKFEHIHVCLSPQYIPKNHWHYFTMFINTYEHFHEKDARIENKKFEHDFRYRKIGNEILY